MVQPSLPTESLTAFNLGTQPGFWHAMFQEYRGGSMYLVSLATYCVNISNCRSRKFVHKQCVSRSLKRMITTPKQRNHLLIEASVNKHNMVSPLIGKLEVARLQEIGSRKLGLQLERCL